ncbi:YebC/PmpR family DNA-binding transcriptional regulator [Desulfatirhabdium butyrativorans]|uniref:YebC/PmpR family DNA-binding transcriptional regulator n=1 Tax=Desulfatirhabdium butyrativorans TaxID=340467 RepID=UPI000482123C|nr:YebC/PmpR family DNA-binding transcriptional regulator [Desulfatirhabdium butyrativorans]
MSGHNKWSTIKHKKGAADARRGRIFTRLIKELTISARMGGGDPNANPRLRSAILAAKAENMPKDNIDRAIKRGTGELEGTSYEESTYEGYGPGGAAILVDSLTDNKNRAVAEIRHIFSKYGGSMGENGCVSWMFSKKGYMSVSKADVNEERLMEIALEAGAEDVREDEDGFEVITAPADFETVRAALDEAKIPYSDAEITMLPQNTLMLQGKEAESMVRLMDALDGCEDVQKIYTNADIPEEMANA